MIYFVEFNMNYRQKVIVNVDKIIKILASSDKGRTEVFTSEQDFIYVLHEYSDVIKMIACKMDIQYAPIEP